MVRHGRASGFRVRIPWFVFPRHGSDFCGMTSVQDPSSRSAFLRCGTEGLRDSGFGFEFPRGGFGFPLRGFLGSCGVVSFHGFQAQHDSVLVGSARL